MKIEEMKEHVIHKLRLLATLYFDRRGAFELLSQRVVVWTGANGIDEVSFLTFPEEEHHVSFETLIRDQHRNQCANCGPLSLSILRGALDDSPPQYINLIRDRLSPETLDSIERRRDPHVSYEAYLGFWNCD